MTDEEARAIGLPADVPYGLRIATTSLTLKEDPAERLVLVEMLGLIVRDDVRFSMVAQALNDKGFRTCTGSSGRQARCSTCCRGWSRWRPRS